MAGLTPVFVELRASIDQFEHQMGKAKKEITGLEKHGASSFQKLAAAGRYAAMAIGTAAVGIGILAVKTAGDFEQSHAHLEVALKNAGSSYDKLKPQIAAASKEMEKFGFTNAQTEEALASFTVANQNPKKALKDMTLAADLAASAQVDLRTASIALAKAQEGNLRPLKALGIDLPIVASSAVKLMHAHENLTKVQKVASDFLAQHGEATSSASRYHAAYEKILIRVSAAHKAVNDQQTAGDKITKALSDRLHGTAAAAANTFDGQLKALKASSEDMAKSLGLTLIPKIEFLIHKVKSVADWFGKHKAAGEALAIVLGGVVSIAIGAYIIQAGTAAVASIAASAATAAWAVECAAAWVVASGGTILLIAAVIAAAYVMIKNWKRVWNDLKQAFDIVWGALKKAFDVVWKAIKDAFDAVWGWIKRNWKTIVEIIGGPLAVVVIEIVKHWDKIKSVIMAGVNAIKGFFKGMWNGLGDGLKVAVNFIIDQINSFINKFNALSRISIAGKHPFGSIAIPPIPHLAKGGIVNSPTLALIGEAGPEAVVPLSKMGSMGGGTTVHIYVAGSVISQSDFHASVRDGMAQLMRRKGLSPALLGV